MFAPMGCNLKSENSLPLMKNVYKFIHGSLALMCLPLLFLLISCLERPRISRGKAGFSRNRTGNVSVPARRADLLSLGPIIGVENESCARAV